jgi:FkbM family methyltransferase
MFRRAVQGFLRAFGYQLVTREAAKPTWGLTQFFPLLKQFGFAPGHIWDVGANRGDWTRAALEYFPAADYTLIEPQDHLKEGIAGEIRAGHRIRWVNAGAGSRPGVFPLYVSAKDQSSSFLDYDRIKDDSVRKIDVPIRTLDEIRSSLSLPVPEMLKIDAEGFDLRVLEGASEFLGRTEIILVEAAIAQLDFENSARNVINAMDRSGYRLVEITDLHRSPNQGVLWLCELAFLLKSSQLFSQARY